MTTFAPEGLADGELPTVQTPIFTASADVGTYVKKFSLFNKNAATQTVLLYITRAAANGGSGVPRVWKRYELDEFDSAEVIDESVVSIRLLPGDAIEAVTTTANAVDYDIDGVTEVN